MENFDGGEVIPAAFKLIKKATDGGKPFFVWLNTSRMHLCMRLGAWKFHFSTKEDYYANVVPRTVPLIFNIRADPFESYDSTDSDGHLIQKMSWLVGPMGELMQAHIKSLVDNPPVQGGKSFDMSNVIEQVMDRGHQ